MNIFFLLLCLTSFLMYASCQITVSISGPSLVKPKDNIRLICKVEGAQITDGSKIHAVDFTRQLNGDTFEFLAHLNYAQGTAFNPTLKSRLTLSRDTGKNEVYLDYSQLMTEDSGTYYCTKHFDYWGQGTMVTVTSVGISAPSVFPLIPCCKEVDFMNRVTMGCLATGFMPDPLEIKWNGGNIKSGVWTTNPFLSSTSGLFIQSSQLSIPASEWNNSTYKCNVKHPATGTNQEKTLRVLPCIQPVVQLFVQSPCSSPSADVEEYNNVNATLDLVCLISDYYPGKIKVKWLINWKDDVSAEAYTSAPLRTEDDTFSAKSRLTILKGQWNRNMKYSCIVTHTPSDSVTTANISKCAEPCLDKLEVYLIPPSFEDMYLNMNAKITCLVSNMRTTENFDITWTRATEGKLDVVTEDTILHDNGTFSAVSVLTVCTEEWEKGEKFTCIVRNQDLPSPIKKIIFKQNGGTPKAPSLYLLSPAQDEILQQETVSLTGLVMGFFPSNIFIKWQQNGQEISKDRYVNTSTLKKEGELTYFAITLLTISAVDWNKGDIFTCTVGHEALPFHLIQQSIDKSTGKPTNVNVSLVMSETANTCY